MDGAYAVACVIAHREDANSNSVKQEANPDLAFVSGRNVTATRIALRFVAD